MRVGTCQGTWPGSAGMGPAAWFQRSHTRGPSVSPSAEKEARDSFQAHTGVQASALNGQDRQGNHTSGSPKQGSMFWIEVRGLPGARRPLCITGV